MQWRDCWWWPGLKAEWCNTAGLSGSSPLPCCSRAAWSGFAVVQGSPASISSFSWREGGKGQDSLDKGSAMINRTELNSYKTAALSKHGGAMEWGRWLTRGPAGPAVAKLSSTLTLFLQAGPQLTDRGPTNKASLLSPDQVGVFTSQARRGKALNPIVISESPQLSNIGTNVVRFF